jgi:hypothetical protein
MLLKMKYRLFTGHSRRPSMPILIIIGSVKPLSKSLRGYGRKKVEFREDYFDTMPSVEIDK